MGVQIQLTKISTLGTDPKGVKRLFFLMRLMEAHFITWLERGAEVAEIQRVQTVIAGLVE